MVEQDFKCFYSGLPIDAKTYRKTTASVDRRDSSKGYTRDNIQLVHKNINYMKWILSEDLFLSHVVKIYENMKDQKLNKEFNKYFNNV